MRRDGPTKITAGVGLFVLTAVLLIMRSSAKQRPLTDLLVVLAGGVDDAGLPHETVMRRLRKAANVHKQQSTHAFAPSIVCNGGGTTHKPKWVDPAGYAVPEAALMGKQLMALGVPEKDIYVEGYSDDTIGNAFFLRVMHADLRPDWRRLRIITSKFQMARTIAIYDWIFSLTPLPANKAAYELSYESVNDSGAVPERVLTSRRRREAESLKTFLAGDLIRKATLAEVHQWIYLTHNGYTATGGHFSRVSYCVIFVLSNSRVISLWFRPRFLQFHTTGAMTHACARMGSLCARTRRCAASLAPLSALGTFSSLVLAFSSKRHGSSSHVVTNTTVSEIISCGSDLYAASSASPALADGAHTWRICFVHAPQHVSVERITPPSFLVRSAVAASSSKSLPGAHMARVTDTPRAVPPRSILKSVMLPDAGQ